jgi:nicotinamidase/pyrazinamidase
MASMYDLRTALLIIDVQNDFADPAGGLYVRGAEETFDRLNAEIAAARAAGAPIVYTQDWHPPETPHFEKDGGTWPVHCVRDTWGAELVPGLEIAGAIVRKGTGGEDGYSGFTVRDPQTGTSQPTDLDRLLREHGVESLVVGGLATDYCVGATALDGAALGYRTTVLRGAIRAVDLQAGDGDRALEQMEAAGVLLGP